MLKLNHYYLGYDIYNKPIMIKLIDCDNENTYKFKTIWGSYEYSSPSFQPNSNFGKRLVHLELSTPSLEACMELYPELFI